MRLPDAGTPAPDPFDQLLTGRVLAIFRGSSPAETVALAERAWDAGIAAVEIPIGAPEQVPALVATVAAGRKRGRPVGAGTVITLEHCAAAVAAGAAYTVAPGLDPAVREASRAAGLPHLPGVATPTEVQRAWQLGCRWLKVFPARSLGADWFRDIRGPFPDLRLVATGGIDADTAPDYLAAGATMVAVGAAAADRAQAARLVALR